MKKSNQCCNFGFGAIASPDAYREPQRSTASDLEEYMERI